MVFGSVVIAVKVINLLCDLPKVLTDKSQVCVVRSSCYQNTLCLA